MALRKNVEIEGNSVIQTPIGNIENGAQRVVFSAYVKVTSITGNKNQMTASVHFAGDANRFTKQYQVPVSIDDESPNFIKQIYEYLKTLPEFAGATDC